MINIQTFRLIIYGLGNSYQEKLFKPIRNGGVKPHSGGLWASPINCNFGWYEWCKCENFGNLSSSFEIKYTGQTLTINSFSDLTDIIWQKTDLGWYWPDYEAMSFAGINGIYLTQQGEKKTRFSEPGLYGYDCECVLIMNHKCIKIPS